MKATSALYSRLKKDFGVDLEFTTDYVKKGQEVPSDTKEILVGNTNREESVGMRYSDYQVAFRNDRIILNGGSGAAVGEAVEWFVENCIAADGTVTVPKEGHAVEKIYPMENLKLNGTPLKDYYPVIPENANAGNLRTWLGENAGICNEDTTGKVLLLEGNKSLDLNEISFDSDKTQFRLQYSSFMNQPSFAVDAFIKAVKNCKTDNLTLKGTQTVTIANKYYDAVKDVRDASVTSAMIWGDTDKNPISYQIGDTVSFQIALYSGDTVVSCPKFVWEAATDDGKTYWGECDGSLGKAVVKIPATGTGFIRLKVFAKDEKGNLIEKVTPQSTSLIEPTMFGAGVNTSELSVSVSEPSDFDSFWEKQVNAVKSVAPDVMLMEAYTPTSVEFLDDSPKNIGGYDYYRVRIKAPSECGSYGTVGVLTVPKNATPGSLGITVCYNGYGVSDLNPKASGAYAVLNVSAHSIELGREASYYDTLGLSNYCFTNTTKESSYFRTMIMRDLQAVRFMKAYCGTEGVMKNGIRTSLNLWNGTLRVCGGSQGAFQGIAVASLDDSVNEAFWWIPWMCDVGGTTVGKMASGFRPSYTDALRYYDTLFFAERITGNIQITLTIGLGDFVCPPSGTMALYNTLGGKITATFVQGMTHGYTPAKRESYTLQKKG